MTAALHHPAPHHVPTGSNAAWRRRVISLVAVGVFALCVTLLVAAYFQSRLVAGQHRVDQLERQRVDAERLLERDGLDLAIARSPETIKRRAQALGMVTADERKVVGAPIEEPAMTNAPAPVEGLAGPVAPPGSGVE